MDWTPGLPDGDHIFYDSSKQAYIVTNIMDVSPDTNNISPSLIIPINQIKDEKGYTFFLDTPPTLCSDRRFALFVTNIEQQWRYSIKGMYFIYDVQRHQAHILANYAKLQYALWAPHGHRLVFVLENNVYLATYEHGQWIERPLTFDGKPNSIYHGVADWVYEEEVLSSKSALFWSPQGETLTWLSFDDRDVPEYELPHFYDPSAKKEHQYPQLLKYRYPKPGFPNPTVSVFMYRVASPFPTLESPLTPLHFPPMPLILKDKTREPILAGIHWLDEFHFMVPILNRIQTARSYVLFDVSKAGNSQNTLLGELVREERMEHDQGWIEPSTPLVPIHAPYLTSSSSSSSSSLSISTSYVTLAPVKDYLHLVWYPSFTSTTPHILTRGDYEVTEVCGYHADTHTLYYLTTVHGPTTRTLYKMVLKPSTPSNPRKQPFAFQSEPVHPDLPTGYYSCQFSPLSNFYVLTYQGPNLPWQRAYSVAMSNASSVPYKEILSNQDVASHMDKVAFPNIEFTTLPGTDGQLFHAMMIYPPDFDQTQKHPVLLKVYNGPNSQLVLQKFNVDIHAYWASKRRMVTVMVDTRGTAYRGNAFRFSVYRRLGTIERNDQLSVVQHLTTLPWVDASKIGVWGWSYGGYLTCRIIEKNTFPFAFGMAVAPVTDWLFYDSIYTERYMQLPDDNMDGYNQSSIQNMDGFKSTHFLLLHGHTDDNVHLVNSLALLRKFQTSSVHSYQFQLYPESSHSIHFLNAYKELMELMDRFIGHTLFGEEEYVETYVKTGKIQFP